MTLPVSVQIISLNEESNIVECLERVIANSPDEILVIDGGSDDDTVPLAEELGATVIQAARLGRGNSRRLGYMETQLPYVALLSADDRLEDGWLASMLAELERGSYAALQGSLRVKDPKNFWERGWQEYYIESVRPQSDVKIVGHPALYRTDALQAGPEHLSHEHEDTQMSVSFELRGLRQGIFTPISQRTCPTTWRENKKKWREYGSGYRAFINSYPSKRVPIAKHLLWRIPISRGWRPVARGRWSQPIWSFLMSLEIWIGFLAPVKSKD